MATRSSTFLNIAQEIRDLIYNFAVGEDRYDVHDVRDSTNYRVKRMPIGTTDRWQWEVHHAAQAPIPEYLCLMLVNRQVNDEVRQFLDGQQRRRSPPATITTLLEYPKLFATFTSIPQPPSRITRLDLLVRVNHIFHPAYISRGSQNAILSAVSDTLKRYIHRGPHLARRAFLRQPLHLETARITVAGLGPFPGMRDEYGFVEPQVENLFTHFVALLRRFCRSGLPWGCIDAFEVRLDGRPWERIPVTSNLWDEEDFVFFQYGGFNWDSHDTTFVQPDQIAW